MTEIKYLVFNLSKVGQSSLYLEFDGCTPDLFFTQPFHCPHYPWSWNVAPNTLKVYNIAMYFLQCCNKQKS